MPPSYGSTINTKIANLRTRRTNGEVIEVHELIKVSWPSPTGAKWYSVTQTDETASVSPIGYGPTSGQIDNRLIPAAEAPTPAWFQAVSTNAEIGDEEVELNLWDGDDVFSTLMNTHGEGIPVLMHYWFPQETLMLPFWDGHLRYESAIDVSTGQVTVKAVQGFRDADGNMPSLAHFDTCQAAYPPQAGMTTQAQIDEGGCPRNVDIGGGIGTPGILTCDRLSPASCTARGINPFFHLSHYGMQSTVVNNQTHGPRLYSLSNSNNTNLPEPTRVVMGTRRVGGMQVMEYRRDYDNNHPANGWFYALYEACRGPIQGFTNPIFQVNGEGQFNADAAHGYGYVLGTRGQGPISEMTTHGYSLIAYLRYKFGWVDPSTVDVNQAQASAIIAGLNDIRIYTGTSSYSLGYTSNRVWQIMKMMADKIWGYGLDYAEFDIQSWIDAADWADDTVRYTDPTGTTWDHVRSESHVELVGRKISDQINDMCMAGRLSRPFRFNGKICIAPLKAFSSGELAAAPVFATEAGGLVHGLNPNIIARNVNDEDMTTLKVLERLSDKDLPNRIKCTIDDQTNNWEQTLVPPMEDVSAQYRAGRVLGNSTRKTNEKEYALLGVTNRSQAVKMEASLLDLGPNDEGGLQNNLPLSFDVWFIDALDLYPTQPVSVLDPKLDKYGFTYYRIKKMKRNPDLTYTLECQAYNRTYMDAFETAHSVADDGLQCSVDSDCPDGQVCYNGRCIPADICVPTFGTVSTDGEGMVSISINPC